MDFVPCYLLCVSIPPAPLKELTINERLPTDKRVDTRLTVTPNRRLSTRIDSLKTRNIKINNKINNKIMKA